MTFRLKFSWNGRITEHGADDMQFCVTKTSLYDISLEQLTVVCIYLEFRAAGANTSFGVAVNNLTYGGEVFIKYVAATVDVI